MATKSSKALTGKALQLAVLRFIAREEPLVATLGAFPQLDRNKIQRALERAAALLEGKGGEEAEAPPAYLRLRLYSDGVARGNPGPAGAGAVLVEPSGQLVDKLGKFLGHQTNNYAEYMGLLMGLKRARELNVREVEVFADSELMIRQLGGRYQVKSPSLRPLYEETLQVLNGFERVKLVVVPREMNRAADEMSNRAIDERM
ncbi:MAG: RNase H [Archangium gephyra]|uniref:RNase H n=1 Tax=Archangium gephyra TaxID=48 RepID=A0A2W5TFX8_9BACT|nr:MAG: RNase H [Archangium gephyra]